MKKIILVIFVAVITVSLASIVSAGMLIPAADQAKNKAKAPEKSPVIDENWQLERIDFIHYAKPDNKPGKNPPKSENLCYKLLGVKWKDLPVDYVINILNPFGLSESFVSQTILTSAESWDSQVSAELLNDNYVLDNSAEYGVQNYENAIVFDDYNDNNVIAVTSIWYTPRGKKIVEFDILFNTRFNWGDATVYSSLMDLENIAIHELGHAIGLDDIYNSTCSAVTMYAYSEEGEISKRTLEQADIEGIKRLYE